MNTKRFAILVVFLALFCSFPLLAQMPAQASAALSTPAPLNTGAADSAAGSSGGSDGFFSSWFGMVAETQSEQPHWITPLATTTPRLEQEFRYDVQTQPHNSGVVTDNFGVSKGLEIIPAKRLEVILAIPPFIVNNPDSKDGMGDWQFLIKYRILSKNEEHGNYILTAFFQVTFPTGEYHQGVTNTVITPTIAYGKGYHNFDIQGTLGISLPTANEVSIGRNLTWNNALQYRVFKKIWPETEVNFVHYYQGEHGGHTATYLTPGVVLGKFHLWHRLGFTVGGGYEIAVTSFHPTNHIAIASIRFPF